MPQRVMPAEQGIVLDSLSAGYGQTLIVDDIHLTIPHGKMTVLAGANGSGKSTLLSTIARMLKPLGDSHHADPGGCTPAGDSASVTAHSRRINGL